jgi:hypothetical protein
MGRNTLALEIVEAGNIFRAAVIEKLIELKSENENLQLDQKDIDEFNLILGEFWAYKDPSKIISFIESRIGAVK